MVPSTPAAVALPKNFSASNPNFLARILITVLGLLTVLGIKFPSDPTSLGTEIATTISTSGLYAVIALMAVSVIMPIYNFIKSNPKPSLLAFFGSPNTWIYLITLAFAALVLIGINIPDGTAEAIVAAAYTKDWSALIGIILLNVFDPFIRWLRDKRNKEAMIQAYTSGTVRSSNVK